MLLDIKSKISQVIETALDYRRSFIESKSDKMLMSSHLIPGVKLTKEEKHLIRSKWDNVTPCPVHRGYSYFLGQKCLGGFDPEFLPSSFYYPYVVKILNPTYWKQLLTHKGLFQLTYSEGISHPVTLIRSYGGVLFDKGYKPIQWKDVQSILYGSDKPLLFKPATDSSLGNGIRLFQSQDMDCLVDEVRTGRLFGLNTDFVIQEVVEQSSETALLNSSSLNCMRVTTLNLNGRVSVCSRAIKCGPANSVVDNIGTGRRGVIVGLLPDGQLNPFGFYGNGEKAVSHNNVCFKGRKISGFPQVEAAALRLHERVSKCRIIGWDIALDSNNSPVLIEGNVVYPGIALEQMCSGPIFGERTDEVIQYLKDSSHLKSKA